MYYLSKPIQFKSLHFDNRFITELPGDPETTNTRRQVTGACYSQVQPKKVARPERIAYSAELASALGLPPETCESVDFEQVFSGNRLLPGMSPYAMCYGGHQFGNWAGQLGDGRAINLGEVISPNNTRWALQLKGAGPTPYSRTADGLAVLRSSIREFLCSEAMFHLGVPTTRALSLILSGEQVVRDMFYDGHPKQEAGAVVCRVAPSFIRFGNFQLPASRGEIDLLKQLVDFTIRTDFPQLGKPSKETYLGWFAEVSRLTAEMIVHWMRVGFVHGVMNTDNMSILGLTIDYGPYGWLEDYDPDWTPNTTDAKGRRYRFGNQPAIAHWNLYQLANAIYPLIEEVAPLENILKDYIKIYEQKRKAMMAQKLGLQSFDSETDPALVDELLEVLQIAETDMSLFYRNLANVQTDIEDLNAINNGQLLKPLMDAYYEPRELNNEVRARIADWLRTYIRRLKRDALPDKLRRERMNDVNPLYVLRNYLAQLAIDKSEQGDHSMVTDLLELLKHPYDEQAGKESYAQKRPEWARHRAGCSMLSCSS